MVIITLRQGSGSASVQKYATRQIGIYFYGLGIITSIASFQVAGRTRRRLRGLRYALVRCG